MVTHLLVPVISPAAATVRNRKMKHFINLITQNCQENMNMFYTFEWFPQL